MIFKCEFCPCFFFTAKDLKRHMEAFSFYAEAHSKNWLREMERRERFE